MTETTPKYTVGNIVAIIACLLLAAGTAFNAFFGDHSTRFERSAGFMGVFMTVGALVLGWTAIKAIRSRRR